MEVICGSYRRREKLGEGAFGAVYKASKGANNYALKVVNDTDDNALNEVEILRKVQHRGIVTYFESFMYKGRLCIVMEFANVGTATDHVRKYKETSPGWINAHGAEWNVWRILSQIADALVYLHNFKHGKILHRDLKPDNLLGITIYSKSEKRAGTVWKLADFGIAKLLDARKLNNMFTSTVAGTPIYMAPEVLKGEKYTDTADIWSLGGIMSFWCNVGTHLFADLGKIITWPGGKSTLPGRFNIGLRQLVADMLHPDPKCRPSAEKVLQETKKENRQENGVHTIPSEGEFTMEEIQVYKDVFGVIDEDGSGCVSTTELKRIFDLLDANPQLPGRNARNASQAYINNVLKQADKDGSGTLNFDEFLALMKIEKIEQTKEIFQKVDTDGSGKISGQELAKALRAAGFQFSDEEIAEFLDQFDKDGDGQLDQSEFLKLIG